MYEISRVENPLQFRNRTVKSFGGGVNKGYIRFFG